MWIEKRGEERITHTCSGLSFACSKLVYTGTGRSAIGGEGRWEGMKKMDTSGIEPDPSRKCFKQVLSERDNQLHHVPFLPTFKVHLSTSGMPQDADLCSITTFPPSPLEVKTVER
jgi:hypothetical protein